MQRMRRTRQVRRSTVWTLAGLGLGAVLWIALAGRRPADAYVEVPYTLGRLVAESTNVVVLRVEKVDQEKNLILYRKVQDVKGTHPQEIVRHNIGRGGFHPREWQTIMAWAQPGKTAVFMHNNGSSETCIDGYWYQAYPQGEWWGMSHGEPYLLRSYSGKPEKLGPAVAALLQGQEVVVPCMVDGDKMAIQLRTARVQRMKASLKVLDYNAQRDFVGWGGNDEFRRLAGMPGFSHFSELTRVDPGAVGTAPADVDGDGRTDFCLFGESKVVLLLNDGKSLNESSLPISGGAHSADWADFDGDGRPDLLLATPSGPKLLANTAKGFKDITAALPHEPYWNTRAAAWIDQDGDRKPDILLSNGFLGLRLFRNAPPPPEVANRPPLLGPWHHIGPFENAGGKGFDAVYPPEVKVDLKGEYEGKGGAKCAWKQADFADGQVHSLALYGGVNADAVCYLYRELNVAGSVDLPVAFGSDDTLTVFLNGQKIVSENVQRGVVPDQTPAVLKLRPGRNELLLKICQGTGDWGFWFKAKAAPEPVPLLFADVSEQVGLGPRGIAGTERPDQLAVADVDGDGRQDFVLAAGRGLVVRSTPQGFAAVADSGLNFVPGGVRPVFGDFDGDKRPDLFVPQNGVSKLYRNAGAGKFVDATAGSGLDAFNGQTTSAAWSDFDRTGRPGLFLGVLKGPNRYFRNAGAGKFADATVELGLTQRIFNTRAVCTADVNQDGTPDVLFNNEGQASAALLGDASRTGEKVTGR